MSRTHIASLSLPRQATLSYTTVGTLRCRDTGGRLLPILSLLDEKVARSFTWYKKKKKVEMPFFFFFLSFLFPRVHVYLLFLASKRVLWNATRDGRESLPLLFTFLNKTLAFAHSLAPLQRKTPPL